MKAITKSQAMMDTEFHYGQCTDTVGPRGGVKRSTVAYRANGVCKTWKTRPEEFSLPLKHGLYAYGYLTNDNASDFHLAATCRPRVIKS